MTRSGTALIAGFLAAFTLAAGASRAAEPVNDYPTVVRADYVFGCMQVNGQTREALLVEPMHPVPQCLAVHPRRLGGIRARCALQNPAASKSDRVIWIAVPMLTSPNRVHRERITGAAPRESKGFWEVKDRRRSGAVLEATSSKSPESQIPTPGV